MKFTIDDEERQVWPQSLTCDAEPRYGWVPMKLRNLMGAAALCLAAQALAEPNVADGPPVEGGDMACFVASTRLALAAEKAAGKADQNPEKRASAQARKRSRLKPMKTTPSILAG